MLMAPLIVPPDFSRKSPDAYPAAEWSPHPYAVFQLDELSAKLPE